METQDYILSEWTRYFHVLDYSEMGLNDHQALFDGGLEESSLSHLAFESRYGVMETDQ